MRCQLVRTDAEHHSAPGAAKVRIGAESFRTAPIGTCPNPDVIHMSMLGINPMLYELAGQVWHRRRSAGGLRC